jgi:hypothetical protein
LIRLRKQESTSDPAAETAPALKFLSCLISLDSQALQDLTALSYVWGPKDPGKHKISLDGAILDITPNLDAALRTILHLEGLCSQWIWVDAICINQADTQERNFQVTLMRDLYSRAKRTIAYLGPGDDGAEMGLSWLAQIDAARQLPDAHQWLVGAARADQHELEWKSLNSLFGRQWWSRAWILQETIVSSVLLFVCGDTTLTEMALINALWFLRLSYHGISSTLIARGFWMNGWSVPFNGIYKRFQLRGLYQQPQGQQRLSLGSILSQRYDFHASDPRDYVYAIFRLVEKTGSLIAHPDYNLAVWQVYAAFVRSYADVYRNLDIICLAGSPRELRDLPSWAPDLQIRNKPDSPFIQEDCLWLQNLDAEEAQKKETQTQAVQQARTNSQPTSEWSAIFRAWGLNTPEMIFSDDLRTLITRAIYIDAVDGIAGHHNIVNTQSPSQTRTSSITPSLQPQNQRSAYGTTDATKNAIWRTFLFDRVPRFQTQPAPEWAAALLVFGCARAETARGDPAWRSVWNAMKDFKVDGISLQDWICGEKNLDTAAREAVEATHLYYERIRGREYDPTRLAEPVIPACTNNLMVMQRRFFITDGGYVGMAPIGSRRGDEVWILQGCNIPIMLRKLDEGNREVVGECYVHGIMYGEAMQGLEMGKFTTSTIVLN